MFSELYGAGLKMEEGEERGGEETNCDEGRMWKRKQLIREGDVRFEKKKRHWVEGKQKEGEKGKIMEIW